MSVRVITGDCLDVMPTLAADSIDSIVTDPPYGLSFMGKDWDHGIPGEHFWREALRVAKPGAHLLAFGGTRTFHRLMVAIEDAGWEIRDTIMWVYGSGFPKSLDVSKAIDREAGYWRGRANGIASINGAMSGPNYGRTDKGEPVVESAAQWQGWGTALKPAWEPIIIARKPMCGTVATNVQRYGTGALNIDVSRVNWAYPGEDADTNAKSRPNTRAEGREQEGAIGPVGGAVNVSSLGRWPANLIHDGSDEVVALFPETGPSPETYTRATDSHAVNALSPTIGEKAGTLSINFGDSGSASRFFYCAKADREDRNTGCEAVEERNHMRVNAPRASEDAKHSTKYGNNHPTVKPAELMAYLVRLVTPPGGTVLDPFAGSGSTGLAADRLQFDAILIELDPAYAAIAEQRIRGDAPLFAVMA